MRVHALSLLAASILVSLCLYFALSARQALFPPEPVGEGFPVLLDFVPQPRTPPPRPPRAAQRTAAAPSLSSTAPETPTPQVIDVVNPEWFTRPRHPERRYPREAFSADIEGAVDLDCMVELDGRLTCAVASETPLGWGFGEAALALSREHVMAPLFFQGAPARGRYRMRVPFTQSRP